MIMKLELKSQYCTIRINSLNRSKIIKKEIKKRLGKQAVYKKSVISSIQKMLEKGRESEPAAPLPDQKTAQDELRSNG